MATSSLKVLDSSESLGKKKRLASVITLPDPGGVSEDAVTTVTYSLKANNDEMLLEHFDTVLLCLIKA